MYAVLPFFISVNFAKFDLLLISIHLFSLQMLLFHQNLIIAIVFFTAYLIPPLSVCKEFKIPRSEEHTSELQSPYDLVCRLLLEKKYVLVIRLRSLRLLRVSGIVMRLRMFLLLITFLKASHSFRNRLLVICKNAYLFATMIMTSVSSPFSCCSGIFILNFVCPFIAHSFPTRRSSD